MLPSREWALECFRRMLLIRHFEETVVTLHDQGHFAGHYHAYIGQEATGVAALSCVDANDVLFTTHRNHGHLLARGAVLTRMFAEILGRKDGYNKGKGGTFHIAARDLGFPHTSGIVAGILPIATGAAYAAKAQRSGQIAVCLFGDGALEEGAAPETFNMASLWKLPVLYLCENNGKYGAGRAAGAAKSPNMASYPLTDLPKAYDIPAQQVDGTDAVAVLGVVSQAVQRIRQGGGPQFIEAQSVRWPGSESNWPVVPVATRVALAWDVGLVPAPARDWYRSSDPVLIFVRKLVGQDLVRRNELEEIEREVDSAVKEAAKLAIASPYPSPHEALQDVFA